MDRKKHNKNSKEVSEQLRKFEYHTEKVTGVIKISGGFARAEIIDYDDEVFYVELRWGIQNDCESTVHTEKWIMNRKTLKLKEE